MLAALAAGATASETTVYHDAYAAWNVADNKATGAITLRITAHLRHYRSANQSARTFWGNLKTAFGAASMPAVFADFKQVINAKLSGGNPVPEMERMATLFGHLATNNLTITPSLQGLILLAALPNKWDNVAQLFMQRTDLTTSLTLANVRTAIKQEYEHAGRSVDSSTRKLSAVKRKGPDPSYRPQQPQAGPPRQPYGQQQQQRSGAPKCRGGRQEREKKERRACKATQHDHSHFASTSMIVDEVEPQLVI